MSAMPPHSLSDSTKCSSFEVEYSDSELPNCFDSPRHKHPIEATKPQKYAWRIEEKYKTHCVALVLCLNVGVDPPDIVKTQPCARIECWVDPQSMSPAKALEAIGSNLQQQYERWQPRARYKLSLDPTSEDVKKLCTSLRRNAKDERVLFHYNGHGVPKPTNQGEIWVFNKAFTQYIPLSVYDLQTWMGAPSLYVYDCSNAGVIIEQFKIFAVQHKKDYEQAEKAYAEKATDDETIVKPTPPPSYKNCIQLAACSVGETLPMNPELPADLFTACLTTPVKMAMKWFIIRHKTARVAPANIGDLIDKIPGKATERKSMLGELNWIFTAITDTIAWNALPTELFQQLFRADLLTASLCRNFLLADRILRSYNCTPVSSPALPSLAAHPMWHAWDQTLDLALAQLPDMLGPEEVPYQHSSFFREQLTAFQVWLDLGSPSRPPPDQLPMVLQVLLSTVHRERALEILCRFLSLGEWAVRAVLAVGIFPYTVKLLQATGDTLRLSMVCIWSKIMAVDSTCQSDLVNAKGHKYFLQVLQDPAINSKYRTMAASVLAGIVDNYPLGQEAALQGSLISICLEQLHDPDKTLRMWLAICLGTLWRDYDAARWSGVRDLAHEKLYKLLDDPYPEVRCATVFALGTFIQRTGQRSEHSDAIDRAVALTLARRIQHEASPLVRAQILEALQWLVLTFESYFINVALQEKKNERSTKTTVRNSRKKHSHVESGEEALENLSTSSSLQSLPIIGFASVYMKLWTTLNNLCSDPHPQVNRMANDIVNHINNQTLQMEWNASRDMVDVKYGNSSSLPPSPNISSGGGGRRIRTNMPNTISEDASGSNHDQLSTSATSATSANSAPSHKIKKSIVKTEFVEWATSQFARGSNDNDWQKDDESRRYQERKWWYGRNKKIRREALGLIGTSVARLESQVFHLRSPLPPSVVMFHPYEQHIAVATKENFGIWDWRTGAKICQGIWKQSNGRITDLDYINSHEHSLLAVASATGSVMIYRPSSTARKEVQLVTAWSGLDVRNYNFTESKATSQKGFLAGSLICWWNRNCSLTVGGPARYIRIWDARTELKTLDILTECESGVSALSRHDSNIWCGLVSGGVKGWDERAPNRAHTTHQDHNAPVIMSSVAKNSLATVCIKGEILFYDVRTRGLLATARTGNNVVSASLQPFVDVLACGSSEQCVNIFNMKGETINTIKSYEGFMGARIGPVSCLTYHPYRSALAVGSRDSTVSVYQSRQRR